MVSEQNNSLYTNSFKKGGMSSEIRNYPDETNINGLDKLDNVSSDERESQ